MENIGYIFGYGLESEVMTNEETNETNRPFDSAWGMYYDEFDDAKPDEIETWNKNHKDSVTQWVI